MVVRCVAVMLVVLLGAAGAAGAAEKGTTGPTARMVTAPVGLRLLAPASHVTCRSGGGPAIRIAVRWSRKAIERPVRSVRVLLQRPGSEAVIDSEVFTPARPATVRRATLRASACRANFDVRYELLIGREDRPHDHTSVVFRTHGSTRG
jgi:hypothetical protein